MASDNPNPREPDEPRTSDANPGDTGEEAAFEELYRFRDPPPAWSEPSPVIPAPSIQPRETAGRRRPRKRAKSGDYWALMGCNLIVFVTSACVLVLELTASRLIAKHVGSSLYTWTSVIGVVLAGITVGNYLGGWLADRFPPRRILGWLFLAASVLSFSVLPLDQYTAGLSRPADWEWSSWVLTVVAMNFLLPSIALGTISPVVAALALSRSLKTGITVGNVYAWGALGSIVGTFLTGFYLIETFGTKAIVAMTAASLAAMGVVVAGGQRVFRTAVILGWMQFMFFTGLTATATYDSPWFGGTLGDSLHYIGLTLNLRDDLPGEYHDESSYSYINVADDIEDGDAIKFLKLDKLIHSYYNPRDPTKLYYDYELVYAAVTERAVQRWPQTASVPLEALPGEESSSSEPENGEPPDRHAVRLPERVRYDAERKQLEIRGAMSTAVRDELLALAPSADWWRAVEQLHRRTNSPGWGGFESIELDELPEGVAIPDSLSETLLYDRFAQALTAYEPLSDEDRERLIQTAPFSDYYQAVQRLWEKSRRVSTLFIGGGGFIFPRWIETYFPDNPRIDVAEIDPAVKLAVQREMGLPPDDQTAVNTYVGDARNLVDDCLRRNAELRSENKPPVLYDFVYGDAFNDFSVPWHLTTREFSQKVKELLSPEGVYLVNIIEIYPRAESAEPFEGELPEPLLPESGVSIDWRSCAPPFESLEVREAPSGAGNTLGFRGAMSERMRRRLLELEPHDSAFAAAIEELSEGSRKHRAGRFLGSYVNTIAEVFPHIYVFSSEVGLPHDNRDTFVIVCSLKPLDLSDLQQAGGHWRGEPFAWLETETTTETTTDSKALGGQMESLLALSRGMVLEDDFAPVDNLLIPVFIDQY